MATTSKDAREPGVAGLPQIDPAARLGVGAQAFDVIPDHDEPSQVLWLRIDLSTGEPSKSGKMTLNANSGGWKWDQVPGFPGVAFNLQVGRKAAK